MTYIREMFHFDRKTMGKTFYMPFLIWVITFLLIIFLSFHSDDVYNAYIMIQGVFIPFCCWHLIFRYSEIFVQGAKETLLPYYRKWIIVDFLSYGIIYITLTAMLVVVIYLRYHYLDIISILHLPLLVLFYLCIGAVLIFYTKNIEVTLTIISIYTVIEVVTQGTFMPWPRIFIFLPPFWDLAMMLKFFLLISSIAILLGLLYRRVQRV